MENLIKLKNKLSENLDAVNDLIKAEEKLNRSKKKNIKPKVVFYPHYVSELYDDMKKMKVDNNNRINCKYCNTDVFNDDNNIYQHFFTHKRCSENRKKINEESQQIKDEIYKLQLKLKTTI